MHHCLSCRSVVEIARVSCPVCELDYEGRFHLPRLARLEPAQQHMVEQIVLAAGNLKEVAGNLEISYPTLRKRLDALIQAVHRLRTEDEARAETLLDAVEAGKMTPEAASRLINELSGGA